MTGESAERPSRLKGRGGALNEPFNYQVREPGRSREKEGPAPQNLPGRPIWPGTGGRNPSEQATDFLRNRWPNSAEYPACVIAIPLLELRRARGCPISPLQATTRQSLSDNDLLFFAAAIDSTVVAIAGDKLANGQELTSLELSQLKYHQHLNFRIFENAYSQFLLGAIQEKEWERYVAVPPSMRERDYAVVPPFLCGQISRWLHLNS